MKKLFSIAALVIVVAGSAIPAGPIPKTITITAGTPIQVTSTFVQADSIFFQGLNATGLIEICVTAVGTTPAAHCGTAGQFQARLGSSTDGTTITSAAAGWSYTFKPAPNQGRLIDPRQYWLDGTHSGDTVVASYNQR